MEKITYYIKQNSPRTGVKTSGVHPKGNKELNSVSGDTVRVKRKERGKRPTMTEVSQSRKNTVEESRVHP